MISSHYDPETDVLLEICEGQTHGYFAVMYQGRSFQLRKKFNYMGYPPLVKYLKTVFPAHAHAKNLAQRLNEQFNTTEFSVIETISGRTIPLN
jgi:hypothetical protein